MKIELTVAYVGFGGNTGNGEYFYSYYPNTIMVESANTQLDFVFSTETSTDLVMHELVSSDTENEFGVATKAPDGRSILLMDHNNKPLLIAVSIVVHDKNRNVYISCDPQVLNVPN
jgi:regulatory protein YycH of two-component signal transduction system YycFG